MFYTKVFKLWHNTFKKMGYRETKYNNWVKETKELIIVLRVITLRGDSLFYVDVGVIIKKLYDYGALKYPLFRYSHLGKSLWLLIYLRYENECYEHYLNNLFCYDSHVNTDEEVMDNIKELATLYQSKVVPLFDTLDYWVGEGEDFNDKTTWKPFWTYFDPTSNTDSYFWQGE
jgi:hypothetical protein